MNGKTIPQISFQFVVVKHKFHCLQILLAADHNRCKERIVKILTISLKECFFTRKCNARNCKMLFFQRTTEDLQRNEDNKFQLSCYSYGLIWDDGRDFRKYCFFKFFFIHNNYLPTQVVQKKSPHNYHTKLKSH